STLQPINHTNPSTHQPFTSHTEKLVLSKDEVKSKGINSSTLQLFNSSTYQPHEPINPSTLYLSP
ncbi:MAG: hypothetical protein WCM93_16430, partial [Bacteroidota bacterium]